MRAVGRAGLALGGLGVAVAGIAGGASCSREDGRPAAVAQGSVVDLDAAPFVELEVPPDSFGGRPAPGPVIPLDGTWSYAGKNRQGAAEWTTRNPVRPRGLFFFKAVPGLDLEDRAGVAVPYQHRGGAADAVTWAVDREVVHVYLPPDRAAPGPGDFALRSKPSVARESALHLRLSDEEAADFVRARIYDGMASRAGLLLPAPGRVAWDLEVPPAAELTFVAGMVTPEVRTGAGSSGAELVVELEADGQLVEIHREALTTGVYAPRRVDLSRWSGKSVRLRARSEPGADPVGDLVFVGEPAVASRRADPRRVVFVFIDTLRPDHLSLYGYERDTSAAIDDWFAKGTVFTDARSIAPWTLPSSRSALSGRFPDRWEASTTLQALLRDHGFATGFVAGNVYLSANFGGDRDWDYHQVDGIFPPADTTTDDALAWLDAHDGRDVFLQVHYMTTHLPYKEPASYRYKYAGAPPVPIEERFERGDVREAGAAKNPELQAWIKDRYDNTIAWTTDEVARLLARLGDDDLVVLYSDHGEEFWEHGGHEHGHSTYDELLRVPLAVRGPGFPASRSDAPASLLDLVPTVLDSLGLPTPPNLDGRPLGPVARGERDLADRTRAFGWPLYGLERWGVLGPDRKKWSTTEGREQLYDLTLDAAERQNLLLEDAEDTGRPYREALAATLSRPVHVGWRLTTGGWRGPGVPPPLWALCSVPGGFAAAWLGDDPLDVMHAGVHLVSGDRARTLLAEYQIHDHPVADDAAAVEICWQGGFGASREVYFVPNRPLAEAASDVKCSGYQGDASGGKRATVGVPGGREPFLGEWRTPINRIRFEPNRNLLWQFGIGPAPTADTRPVDGHDPEMADALAQLGYVADDRFDGRGRPCEPPTVALRPDVAGLPVAEPEPSDAP